MCNLTPINEVYLFALRLGSLSRKTALFAVAGGETWNKEGVSDLNDCKSAIISEIYNSWGVYGI